MTEGFQRLTFTVNGQADLVWLDDIQEIVVDNTMRMPSMCTVSLYDNSLKYMDGGNFKIGDAVEIKAGQDGSGPAIFKGEITGIEPIFEETGRASLVLQAYDQSHRLHRGRKTRTFINQTDAAIMQTMLGEVGISQKSIDDPGIRHNFMIQNNQTNMEWIGMRAEQLGYQLYVENGKLFFRKPDHLGSACPQLTWGDDLRSFRPRIMATHQPNEVTLYSWDQLKKEAIIGKGKPPKPSVTINAARNGGATGQQAFSSAAAVTITDMPAQDIESAQAVAGGYHAGVDGDFVQAEGVALGNANIKVGHQVEIRQTGKYSGKYTVTSVRHVYRRSGRWETHFSSSGRHPNSLLHLLDGRSRRDLYSNRINGVVPAIVTNFSDPENLGRVKVQYPWMPDHQGALVESDWVRVAAPGAGSKRGFYWVPEVNDEVLIAFEHGDPNRPYIVGALWNKQDEPPEKTEKVKEGSNITQRIIRSRSGHVVIMDDSNAAPKIIIRDNTGKNEVIIDAKNNNISVAAQKNISLEAGGDITIKATGKVSIESGMDTSIASKAAFKVDAKAPSEIKTVATLKVQGVDVDIKGNASLKLGGNAMAELKSGGIVTVQGTLIKLN